MWNIIDTILVGLCVVTLIVIASGCSAGERSEAILDTVLLVIRNCVQFFRLFMMVRKYVSSHHSQEASIANWLFRNQHSMNTRSARIDFSGISDNTRDPSMEFSWLDRHREFEESFLSDSEEDNQHV